MKIGNTVFSSDLIIFPDHRVKDNWHRKSGHLVDISDLESLLLQRPDLIIAGTGAHGKMRLAPKLVFQLERLGITIKALDTPRAVSLYNQMIKQPKAQEISACFHLTC
ncbi:MAG: hypothetical protein HUK40_00925 [Desulfobacter sp.]|nr:hypothetical protein [Desulfobacter sp.]WDP85612.1 MAG: hypothetical protein HUN05_11115 [Desulfobacter sp.]